MPRDQLIIFVKAPRAGSVKTRLAEAIGPEGARDAYIEMMDRLVANLHGLREVELRFTPDEAAQEVQRWMQKGWRLQPQGSGDLGVRLQNAFVDAFARGTDRVAIIGSDCPDVSKADIALAFEALAADDLVLGPAEDGGYWLIALSKPASSLFANMPWSSRELLEKTISVAGVHKMKTRLLRTLCDIDTPADWERFRRI